MSYQDDISILERAKSLANHGRHIVALQRDRLLRRDAFDEIYPFRPMADFQFFIVALRRIRRAAELAVRVQATEDLIRQAIAEFDKALPNLQTLRNVGEHIDIYALDDRSRHHKKISRLQIQVVERCGKIFKWLDTEVDIDIAFETANQLFISVKAAANQYVKVSEAAR